MPVPQDVLDQQPSSSDLRSAPSVAADQQQARGRKPLHLFACRLEWHRRGDIKAYQELVAALDDSDDQIRTLAESPRKPPSRTRLLELRATECGSVASLLTGSSAVLAEFGTPRAHYRPPMEAVTCAWFRLKRERLTSRSNYASGSGADRNASQKIGFLENSV